MPESYPCFPGLDQISAYLNSFADHFGLRRYVELGTEVVGLRQLDDRSWVVTTRDRRTGVQRQRRVGHVVVATGYHWEPRLPDPVPGADSFPGSRVHSMNYRDAGDYAGKRIVVLGFGNSACDIAVELSRAAATTFLSVRRGVHVVPKQMMGIPIADIANSKWWSWLPFRVQRRFIELLLLMIRGRVTSYGIPEPDHRIFSAPITISDDLLSRIQHGAVTVKPRIDRFESSTVYFTDGTSEEVDAVICCTGYDFTFGFAPRESVFGDTGQVALYRRVVPPRCANLYFLGLVRPVGAVTRLVESQVEWVADLIEGAAVLPTVEEMSKEIDRYLREASTRYGTAAMDSIHVDFPTYLRALRDERAAGRRRKSRGGPSPAAFRGARDTLPGGGGSDARTVPGGSG